MTSLVFVDVRSGVREVVEVNRVIVAGFTGRDVGVVQQHISELADMGVPVPDSTPTFYLLEPDSVRQTTVLVVGGPNTSGEVEPVIIAAGGRLLLTVGSDHTDRDLEQVDIASSKSACDKVVASRWMPVADIEAWDQIELLSYVGGSLYQEGTLGSLLPLDRVLNSLHSSQGVSLQDGDVVFLGTIPAKGGIRATPTFTGQLNLPGIGDPLAFSYKVLEIFSTGRGPFRKPELEFSHVDQVAWVPVEGGASGQTERILAVDPGTSLTTRMLRFERGTDTSELGVLRHDFWEEVYILAGELHDLTLDETFGTGTYACRPPGMPHGPWRSPNGCITFEVRYPAI